MTPKKSVGISTLKKAGTDAAETIPKIADSKTQTEEKLFLTADKSGGSGQKFSVVEISYSIIQSFSILPLC